MPADTAPAPPTVLDAEGHSLGADLSELTKARLTLMVVLTTLAGYYLASRGPIDGARLLHTLVATTLVAVCSSVLNQAMERRTDALMRRTERRPFVTRRLPFAATVAVGLVLGAIGLAEMAWFVGALTAELTALTLAIYLVLYTPMKKLSALNTLVGAIPGALPPLIGATAARGAFSAEGWCLFALLACWQLPHFYAIAFLYREDYHAAGLRMVSVGDVSGRRTAWHAVVTALILVPVSLAPVFFCASQRVLRRGGGAARRRVCCRGGQLSPAAGPGPARGRLFLASIAYLPLVLALLALDKALG